LLSAEERRELFKAVVEDVLTAIEACTLIDDLIIVTDDKAVAQLGREFGAQIRPEPETPGLIEAVTETGRQLAEEGVTTMVFLPGDVPLTTADELELVLEGFGLLDEPEFLIVPASDLGGSNCVACSPPDCMTFGFGEDSFRRHLGIAGELGLKPIVAKLPGIGLDIDTPEDLRELVSQIENEGRDGQEYSTVRFLTMSGLIGRVNADIVELG
ncbi:MAG: 2-phospho-L-lactate guanylyltransferase, partial [Gammaproteobacteria bacterium]|nr:2-phospho-L-lactate guanylyltransferase [Gammaproteobacteria bacterium]